VQIATNGATFADYLIMIGFMLNAAVPPIHAWLPDAYPEATVTGAVFMCAFTTKTAVYVLARGFPGFEALAILGAIMTVYGVGYAAIENDARRILAYHIVSQVGYMVCGVGIGTAMAVNGAISHAYAHIIYKALLFMGVGAVLEMTGKTKLNELGGLYKQMPLAMIFTVIGGISISGFPLTSGFISKSMIIAAAGESHRIGLLLMMTLAAVGTFLSVGIKLPYFIWFG
jgi:multicomponent Na+:H+ antiporter subunit D